MPASANDIFKQIATGLEALPQEKRKALVSKTKSVFVFDVKTSSGQEKRTLNLKKDAGSFSEGAAEKPEITIAIAEPDFVALAEGKQNGQKLFMGGKLKIKGNMMLAMKLDGILKELKPQSKL
ncbi:SCP2 sterol-binding domain-containing protein [Thamnocephalis sphaerospora]|uniref:SCP2 sterol-binding domain-containing protein n=1 Tax=Thamnocephalis sphaerospora TaxID=78915 RepID=A0A4P9XJB1_9FUNG|nr:SCP2 sterol-binding domain-containing protein [Thamnocephalis sphaerospora]|eukprot:RKP05441.1 SCP2 sterol-binding domain-containing protein [Thamnocephalis sphaerospora]